MREYLGRFEGDRFITPGVGWGYDNTYPRAKHCNGRWAVMHVPGVTSWACLGCTSYKPASYFIARFETVPDMRLGAEKGDMVTVMHQEGAEVEPGRRWKRALDQLKAECDQRAEGDEHGSEKR